MNEDLQRHLDGDLPPEAFPEDARGEAEAWERLLDAFRTESSPPVAPPWLESRVMAEIEAMPQRGVLGRIVVWLLSPRTVRVSPLLAGAVAAILAAVLLVGGEEPTSLTQGGDPGPGIATQAGMGEAGRGPVVFV
jgi:hypothetical protein